MHHNGNSAALEFLQNWLESYLNFEKLPQKNLFWLNTMQFLCERFKNPEKLYKKIHIAGSKGKGSVSTFTASIISEYGQRCGLYTSPHIMSFSERIGTSQGTLPEDVYEKAVEELIPLVESIIPKNLPNEREPTWFELVTLFSFLCFKHFKAQWAVFETGMGGRLDATNVIDPEICIITPIELEHTEYLGDTIEKIAFEKAGIMKNGIPVITSDQKPEVLKVLQDHADKTGSSLFCFSDFIDASSYFYDNDGMNITLKFKSLFKRPINTKIHLLGDFQVKNAALACIAVKKVIPDISEECIERGLSKAFIAGRFEVIKANTYFPLSVMDGAHTVNSISCTLKTFNEIFKNNLAQHKAHLLFACASDKNSRHIAELFFVQDTFSLITLTRPGSIKESNVPVLHESFITANREQKSVINLIDDHEKAIIQAFEEAKKENAVLLITGSFYLLAEVKKIASKKLESAL